MIYPGSLRSWWDMLDLDAKKFLRLMEEIHRASGALAAIKGDLSLVVDDVLREAAKEILRLVTEMGLPVSALEAAELEAFFSADEVDGNVARERLTAFTHLIRNEMSLRKLLILTAPESELYQQKDPLFGAEVQSKFPSLIDEITESGKCLALGRSTASVFHSIRCLEGAIRALSRCLGIPDPTQSKDQSWKFLLDKIKTEIDRRWPNNANRFQGDGKIMEAIHGCLAAMKNPYRNPTMHLDEKYTPEEARHIQEVVRGLLAQVANRMDQNGEPKA